MHAISNRASREAADEDVEAGVHLRGQRIQQYAKREGDDIGDLAAVACGREQEGQRRQQKDRRAKRLSQIGGKEIADRIGGETHRDKTEAKSVDEGDPAFTRYLRQEAMAF